MEDEKQNETCDSYDLSVTTEEHIGDEQLEIELILVLINREKRRR